MMVIELQEYRNIITQLEKDTQSIRDLSSMQRKGKRVETKIKYLKERKSTLIKRRDCLKRELEPYLSTFNEFDRKILSAYYFSSKSPNEVYINLRLLGNIVYKSQKTMMRRIKELLETPPEYR